MQLKTRLRGFLAVALVPLLPMAAMAADWPTYRHDVVRSGVSPEKLTPPLKPLWTFQPRHAPHPAWGPPKPVPVEGILELPRVHFDRVFHVAVAEGLVFFGSSADNKVYALDVGTGKVRWSRFTGGPIRLAPTAANDYLYVASDDGTLYCYRAHDGDLRWRFRNDLTDRKVLGRGKMVSLSPIRSGVVVDGDVVYFAAGIFPAEGIALYALRAPDGTVVWEDDSLGEDPRGAFSPQGYMLASPTTLFVPNARVSPAAFDRQTGALLYRPYFGKQIGGTYAVLLQDQVVTGTGEMLAFSAKSPGTRLACFKGNRLIASPTAFFLLGGGQLMAVDRKAYPAASQKLKNARGRASSLARQVRGARAAVSKTESTIKNLTKQLPQTDRRIEQLVKKGGAASELAKLRALRASLNKSLIAQQAALDKARQSLQKAQASLQTAQQTLRRAEDELRKAIRWEAPCDCSNDLIMAGDVLFAGGKGKVIAVSAGDGKPLWQEKVQGTAGGLAAAEGRLFVSTTTGAIYCFGPADLPAPGTVRQAAVRSPYPRDELTPVYEAAAEAIVKATGVSRGYCLDIGCRTGRLAYELAKRSELRIYGLDYDPANVAAARKALDAAGLYGSRVCVEQADLTDTRYPDYFANLVVSERALLTGKLPDPKELFRLLKPCGGAACIGQPPEAEGKVQGLSAMALRGWLWKAGLKGARMESENGLWLRIARGPLEGAGKWTHEYAEPGNSACGDDTRVRCPFGVLWFGDPGPSTMVNRHEAAAAPLAADGRMFVQGENLIMAYDAYNGLKLWERQLAGARRTRVQREASNLALGPDSLYVALGENCLRLDAATGKTKATYKVPQPKDGKPRKWGYVATADGILFGSAAASAYTCDTLFALDPDSGDLLWTHQGGSIPHITIAISEGRVFFADSSVSAEQRRAALAEKRARLSSLRGAERTAAEKRLKSADVRLASCLDARTGRPLWSRPLEVSDCRRISRGGGELAAMVHDGVLVFCAASTDGHLWRNFFAGEFARRTAVALSARTGELLWAKAIGYRHKPLIVNDTLIAEPWAFDLRTGRIKMRKDPLTGQESPWQFARPGHHCGCVVASPTTLFFRSYTIAFYDLLGDYGTIHFGGQRPGCWINVIPANGLVLAPEASSGCMCPFPLMCSVVLEPRKDGFAWGMASRFNPGKQTMSWGESKIAEEIPREHHPVAHVAINLGAPGDRRDERGTLWLAYPRPRGALVADYKMQVETIRGFRFYRHRPTGRIRGTDAPWLFASGVRGVLRCTLPVVERGLRPGLYTVRLGFIEPGEARPGVRVFDVKLQGKTVLRKFDICKTAGWPSSAVVKEFPAVEIADNLTIEFVPSGDPSPQTVPILNCIELSRSRDLVVGVRGASFLTSDARRQVTAPVSVTNWSAERFVGQLRVGSTEGIKPAAETIPLDIPPGQTVAPRLSLTVAQNTNAGHLEVPLSVLRGDGQVEATATVSVLHLGSARTVTIPASEDAFVRKNAPKRNYGSEQQLWVDGGNRKMGDGDHGAIFLRFPLNVPGRPKSATLRLHVGTWQAAESGDSGKVCLVEQPWSEAKLTYQNQPKPSRDLAAIGRIRPGQTVERKLDVPLEGRKELSLAIVPTSCDGAGYCSREMGNPAELIVEFGP